MQHYLVETQTNGGVDSAFPHVPQDILASYQDYLEDKLSNGFALVSVAHKSTNECLFVFKVVAK